MCYHKEANVRYKMKKLWILLLLFILVGCKPEVKRLDAPQGLAFVDGSIVFDEVENASSYFVKINDETIEIDVTSYGITTPGSYTVKVKASGEGFQDSYYSDSITFIINTTFSNERYNYSLISTFDLLIKQFSHAFDLQSISLNEQDVSLSNVVLESRQLKLKSSFLKTLETGLHVFEIILDSGSFEVTIIIHQSAKPYIISNNEIKTDMNSNASFLYELFGGEIATVSGHSISADDYEIVGNQLTIKQTFITSNFNNDAALSMIVLGYSLKSGENTVIGYLFILKQTQ
jgi:hypothetical protein